MNQQDATTGEAKTLKQPTRNVATKLFVLFKQGSTIDMKEFDFKQDLDVWLNQNDIQVLRIIRGTEKKIRTTSKVVLL